MFCAWVFLETTNGVRLRKETSTRLNAEFIVIFLLHNLQMMNQEKYMFHQDLCRLSEDKSSRPMALADKRAYSFFKRTFDLFGAFLCTLLFCVPMLIIALAIYVESRGPIIFKQQRIGQYGNLFYIYKFRSLKLETPDNISAKKLVNRSQYNTRVGRVIRTFSLDELPQLFNIIKGDMSFVGFRPVCTSEIALNQLRAEAGILEMKPGLTGLAQIQGREKLSDIDKVMIEMEYLRVRSIWFDLKCIIKTIPIVLKHENVL